MKSNQLLIKMNTSTMNSKNISIAACICILVIAIFSLTLLMPMLGEQDPSDCSALQKFDNSSKRCLALTESELKEKEKNDKIVSLEKEIAHKKNTGEICLSTKESWENIGKNACVAFYPEYFYMTSYGLAFIDEFKDYKKGFVASFVYKNMISFDNLTAKYKNKTIAVSGTITMYEGHPQIRVYDLSQISIAKLINCDTKYGCVYSK